MHTASNALTFVALACEAEQLRRCLSWRARPAANRKKTSAEALIEEHFESANPAAKRALKRAAGDAAGGDASESESSDESEDELGAAHKRSRRMFKARDAASADLFARRESVTAVREQPLEARAAAAEAGGEVRRRAAGSRDVTFVPRCARHVSLPRCAW